MMFELPLFSKSCVLQIYTSDRMHKAEFIAGKGENGLTARQACVDCYIPDSFSIFLPTFSSALPYSLSALPWIFMFGSSRSFPSFSSALPVSFLILPSVLSSDIFHRFSYEVNSEYITSGENVLRKTLESHTFKVSKKN